MQQTTPTHMHNRAQCKHYLDVKPLGPIKYFNMREL